jgi:hypothetical protein
MGEVTAGQDAEINRVEFIKAWEEGLAYVTMSVVAGGFAEAARLFTDDPKKITAAAAWGWPPRASRARAPRPRATRGAMRRGRQRTGRLRTSGRHERRSSRGSSATPKGGCP